MNTDNIAYLYNGLIDQIGLFLVGSVALVALIWGVPKGFRMLKRLAK